MTLRVSLKESAHTAWLLLLVAALNRSMDIPYGSLIMDSSLLIPYPGTPWYRCWRENYRRTLSSLP